MDPTHTQGREKGKREASAKDREDICKKLEMCIDPLNPADHPEGTVNIINGKNCKAEVNVQHSVAVGMAQMEEFERKCPGGFYGNIPKKVVTLTVTKQAVSIGETRVTDMNAIYARIISLLSSSQDIDTKDVLSHELAPVPSSMFAGDGIRIAKNKSQLKKSLEVEVKCQVEIQGRLM